MMVIDLTVSQQLSTAFLNVVKEILQIVSFCRQLLVENLNIYIKTTDWLKSTVFWDIMPRSPLKVNRRFGGTHRLHLQSRRIGRARNQLESVACHLLVSLSRMTVRYGVSCFKGRALSSGL
jgi:hypothetical protein